MSARITRDGKRIYRGGKWQELAAVPAEEWRAILRAEADAPLRSPVRPNRPPVVFKTKREASREHAAIGKGSAP